MRKLRFGDTFKVCQGICEAHQLDNLKRVQKGFIFKDQVENYKGKHRHLEFTTESSSPRPKKSKENPRSSKPKIEGYVG